MLFVSSTSRQNLTLLHIQTAALAIFIFALKFFKELSNTLFIFFSYILQKVHLEI
jgi:hypothetical protein